MSNIAIAILAAGASKRMGQPKQLLPFRGKTLLSHAIEVALNATSFRPVFVVIDSMDNLAIQEESNDGLQILINRIRDEGMSTSIRLATDCAENNYNVHGLLFMNCDQPDISASSLKQLIAEYKTGSIVASRFGGTRGSPAIFDRCFFRQLAELSGDKGAKRVMDQNVDKVIEVVNEQALFDVDTPDDYKSLLKGSPN